MRSVGGFADEYDRIQRGGSHYSSSCCSTASSSTDCPMSTATARARARHTAYAGRGRRPDRPTPVIA